MLPQKLNLQYGERVTIKNTGTELDHELVWVVGLVSRNIMDIYILQFFDGEVKEMPDFGKYHAFCLPESCLERHDK